MRFKKILAISLIASLMLSNATSYASDISGDNSDSYGISESESGDLAEDGQEAASPIGSADQTNQGEQDDQADKTDSENREDQVNSEDQEEQTDPANPNIADDNAAIDSGTLEIIEDADNIDLVPSSETEEHEATEVNPIYRDIISESDLIIPGQSEIEHQTREMADKYTIDSDVDTSVIYDVDTGDMIVSYPDGTSVNVFSDTMKTASLGAVSYRGIEYCSHLKEAEAILRDGFSSRQSVVTVYYKAERGSDYHTIYQSLKNGLFAHTGNPTEGDYIRWQHSGWHYSVTSYQDSIAKYYTFVFTPTYFTTVSQENAVTAEVKKTLNEIGAADSNSDYRTVKKIYDYICSNITYDYTGFNNGDILCHSAYAAVINKTAVCQGYALLFYRMALEAGIDARLIAGFGSSNSYDSAHAWNIVKIGSKYYNLDSTWDAGKNPYLYFLKSNASFEENGTRHQRWGTDNLNNVYDYDTPGFKAAYPMTGSDYEASGDEADAEIYNSIAKTDITLSGTTFTYSGEEICPEVAVKLNGKVLSEGEDYTVSYSDNIDAGKAKLRIDGQGDFYGYKTAKFNIARKNIDAVDYLEISDSEYNYVITDGGISHTAILYRGTSVQPQIDASLGSYQLTEGNDYTLSYENNNAIGDAVITINGIDNFTGSATRPFRIITEYQPINISADRSSVEKGDTCTVSVTGNTGTVSYASSDPAIASVDASTGVVTGLSAGTVAISATASAKYSLYEGIDSVDITVTDTSKSDSGNEPSVIISNSGSSKSSASKTSSAAKKSSTKKKTSAKKKSTKKKTSSQKSSTRKKTSAKKSSTKKKTSAKKSSTKKKASSKKSSTRKK